MLTLRSVSIAVTRAYKRQYPTPLTLTRVSNATITRAFCACVSPLVTLMSVSIPPSPLLTLKSVRIATSQAYQREYRHVTRFLWYLQSR